MFRTSSIALVLLTCASPTLAAEPGLPDEVQVRNALDEYPVVQAARARAGAAKAEAEALRKGPHEFTLSGTYIRRNVDRQGAFDEYDATLARQIRLPGKGRLDREIGKYGIAAADNLAEDARHQSALILAEGWFDWLGSSARARVDLAAMNNYARALGALEKREKAGDASRLDLDLAQAALATARTAAERSAGEAELARTRLSAQFPGMALPADAPELPVPDMDDARLVGLRDHIETNSHEIAAAEAEAMRRKSMAQRAQKDRIADPSVGLRLFSERGGEERGAGVLFSMPLGGGNRRAIADQAFAQATAAEAEFALARTMVKQTADADLVSARFRIAAWKRAREALDSQVAAVTKLRRGHQLGEIDLAELLLGERMAHDAFREEAIARAEAMRALTKLRIDSHELWLAD